MSSYEYVRIRSEDSLFVVTIDNPPLNLLKAQILSEIERVFGEIPQSAIGVIVTGAGNNAFSAGADVKSFVGQSAGGAEDLIRLGHRVFDAIEQFPRPTIAAVNGLALGGGLELAMACDLRISSDRARLGLPEVTLGLMPGWGGTQRLARLVGRARAKEVIFTGGMISAQEALRIGLVSRVVPDGEELRAAQDMLRQIALKTAPLAVREAKLAIDQGIQAGSWNSAKEIEIAGMKRLLVSKDLQEGIRAFLEKRPPKYTGE